jgi:hypothetical protein
MNPATLVIAVVLTVAAAPAGAQARTARPCDRACLLDVLDRYFTALVAHDPTRVAVAPGARFVENLERKKFGEGLWDTASEKPTTFALRVPDPVSGQVGFIGMLEERGEPILLGLRLEVSGGQVVEAEHLIARDLGANNLRNLQSVRPGLLAPVPPAERTAREELLRIAASYYDAVDDNDGSLTPFAADCSRRENGLQTTNNPPGKPDGNPFRALDCATQLTAGAMSYIDTIDNRRVTIADVETGLVFGLSHFRHSMTTDTFPITGVAGIETRVVDLEPFDLPAAHVFKVTRGEMREIEAMGLRVPYGSANGLD